MNKSRGLLLNLILGIYSILIIITLIGFISFNQLAASMSTTELVVNILRSVVLIASIVGIFFWKKLAIYLFVILAIVELISIVIGSMAFDIINIITRLVLPVLLLFAISRKWALFN